MQSEHDEEGKEIQSALEVVEDIIDPSAAEIAPEVAIAGTVIPWPRDDDKSIYLGYRCCGFTQKESLRLMGRSGSLLNGWRRDPEFAAVEARIPEFRQTLSSEYANISFMRNFTLVLEKDYQVLRKAIGLSSANGATTDLLVVEDLSDQEQAYLLKMRQYYTPQQLQVMQAIAGFGSGSTGNTTNEFDFTHAIISIAEQANIAGEVNGKRK